MKPISSKEIYDMLNPCIEKWLLRRIMRNAMGLAAIVLGFSSALSFAEPEQVDVYVAGENGYASYRIPAIVKTTSGTLLAFAEGRKAGRADAGEIDLLLRRSSDNGRTWLPTQVVWKDGLNTCGNPAPVVDVSTGRVHLFSTWNLGSDTEHMIEDGVSTDTRRVYVMHSDDDGHSWGKPEEVTSNVKGADWRWYATGPGHAIQLSNGRLVIPANHSLKPANKSLTHSHVIVSDDHGKTWRNTQDVGGHTNESTVAELDDGRLYINARSYRGLNQRAFAWSDDRGDSWTGLSNDPTLVEPVCQASTLRHRVAGQPSIHLFSNPASKKRRNMTVRISTDGCRTWNAGRVVHEGPAAYSDLCSVNDKTIGLLYERDNGKDAYGRISFATLPLSWLMEEPAVVPAATPVP